MKWTSVVGRPTVPVPFFEWHASETIYVVWFAIAAFGRRFNFTLWRPLPGEWKGLA